MTISTTGPWQATVTWTGSTPDDGDALITALAEHSPALQHHASGATSATLTIQASSLPLAVTEALRVVQAAAADADVVGVEVLADELAQEEADRPTLPELVMAAGAARLLGVSRQRVLQLINTDPSFPDPVLELDNGRVWAADGIRAYGASRDRSPRHKTPRATAAAGGRG